MAVALLRSDWVSGGLVFSPRATASVPANMIQIGNTNGEVNASGVTGLYSWIKMNTTAVTGTARGIRGNASILVASANGTVRGGEFRAANGTSASATDGVNVGEADGIFAMVVGVGKSGPATLTKAYGVSVQLDIDAPNLTVSDARGIYVNVQSGNDTSNTLTACNLAYLEYESVVGTAPAINSAIKIATVGGATGATQLIDATTFNLAVTDTDKVTLITFKNSAGATKKLVYDTSDNAFSAA